MKKQFTATVMLLAILFCGCRPETDVTVLPQTSVSSETAEDSERLTVLINKNSKKYHTDLTCVYASRMTEENRLTIEVPDIAYLLEHGYEPCSRCHQEPSE